MTEYVAPEERTYEQMEEAAKKIHPDARVRILDYGQQQWEIYIPSDFVPVFDLPERFKDTPAWQQYQIFDGSHGDLLSRWGNKNGYRDLPIEGVADYFNFIMDFSSRKKALAEDLDTKEGLIPMSKITDWEPITRELATQYMAHRKTASEALEESYSIGLKNLNTKWSR